MMYSFKINVEDLPVVLNAHKEVGGYIEIAPDSEGKTVTVTFDNPNLTSMNRIWTVRFLYDEPNNEASLVAVDRVCDKIEIKMLGENLDCDNSDKPELQRKKLRQNLFLNYAPKGARTKWEIIKALQGEFEKFPDDTVFTGFSAIGIGKFGTRYI